MAMESSGSMEWNHHHDDIKWLLESFNLMSGPMVDFVHDERDRKYMGMSEAEWSFGFLRPPGVSEDGAAPTSVQPVMMFSSLSDAVSQCVYLKVAHQFARCAKSGSAGGKHISVSGVNEVKDTAWDNGFRAGIHHIFMPYNQDDSGQAHFSKLMLHEYLKHIMVWSSRPELFHYSQSASGFVNQHVLFHESVSISPRFIADSLLNIMTHQQVRLTERATSLIRPYRPHLEPLVFRSGELGQDLKDLEFSPSWTVSEISVNPWISSSRMKIDDDVTISQAETGKTVVHIKKGKIMLKCLCRSRQWRT